jgi:hypothetical protein
VRDPVHPSFVGSTEIRICFSEIRMVPKAARRRFRTISRAAGQGRLLQNGLDGCE